VSVAAALARACHPGPTVAVTGFAAVLAALADKPVATCVLVAGAVLAGQLSIGWSNDRLDAGRDATSGRTDKPVARGALSPRLVEIAIAAALAAAVALSAALGWRAGLLNLATIGCGWSYNLGLKGTWWSWAPYAAAFGALPAVATYARPDAFAPGAWVVVAGAALGVAAHLTNALPDLADDERTGVRGLPHRLGAHAALALAAALLLVATTCIVLGPAGGVKPIGWAGLGACGVLVAVGLPTALRRPVSRASFIGIIAMAAIGVLLLVLLGGGLA
jgi:4-hydroxybenzoate polyprenyltransferase